MPCVVICPGYYGHGIARSLGRLGIPVYGVHQARNSPAVYSRYWKRNFFWDLNRATGEASVDWLLQTAGEIGRKAILIPTDDHSCVFVNDHAEALREKYLFPEQPAGLTRALSNKEQMYFLCKKHSIPTPETLFPKSRKEVVKFIDEVAFPVMLKGIDTVALYKQTGAKMVIVENADALLKYYDAMETPEKPNLMLQEFIPGGSENVWMFNGYFDDQSNCLFEITGRKLRQYPAYTGMTSLGICSENEAVSKQTKDFMKAIGYRGILDIGFKHDVRRDKYYLLDPNPRIGASFRLFVDTKDMDVARALYLHLTGQPIPPGDLVEGRKWLVEPFDIASSIRYWRDGKLALKDWLRSFRGVVEAQWFASDDLRPFGMVWLRALSLSVERLLKKN